MPFEFLKSVAAFQLFCLFKQCKHKIHQSEFFRNLFASFHSRHNFLCYVQFYRKFVSLLHRSRPSDDETVASVTKERERERERERLKFHVSQFSCLMFLLLDTRNKASQITCYFYIYNVTSDAHSFYCSSLFHVKMPRTALFILSLCLQYVSLACVFI